MRIKHFMGYGSVNAKVGSRSLDTSTHQLGYITKTATIYVWGNHEWGLMRDDSYDINQWLMKKVVKVDIDYRDIQNVECNYIPDIDGQEAVKYVVTWREKW